MGLVRGKTRSVSKRHIIGNRSAGGSGAVTTVLNTVVDTVGQLGQRTIYDNQKIHLPYRFCGERYYTTEGYSPLAIASTPKYLTYERTLKSDDVTVQSDPTNTRFYPRIKGVYRVSAFCLVTPETPAALEWTSHELHLYKNDVFYSFLDANTTNTVIVLQGNSYDAFDVLKGTDVIALEPNDCISIVYTFSGSTNMGLNDYLKSYFTIEYIYNQYTEI